MNVLLIYLADMNIIIQRMRSIWAVVYNHVKIVIGIFIKIVTTTEVQTMNILKIPKIGGEVLKSRIIVIGILLNSYTTAEG